MNFTSQIDRAAAEALGSCKLLLLPKHCMAASWDSYGRQGIDIAHKVSSFGFSAAKFGTKLGVRVLCLPLTLV